MGWILSETALRAAEGQLSAELAGGEAAIFDCRKGLYYGLNRTGARIWSWLQQPITVQALRERLLENYDVEPERLERDLQDWLEKLAAKNLIVASEAGNG
jgi:PqqD family protein of HPr-rel-A system